MVRLISVIIFTTRITESNERSRPIIIYSEVYLADYGFFQRTNVKDICIFASREHARKCSKGSNEILHYMGYNVHTQMLTSGLAVACVTDNEYPKLAAKSFMSRVLDIFIFKFPDQSKYNTLDNDISLNIPEIDQLLISCQDPTKADKINAIRSELEETKEIVVKSINDLLVRGETLDDLLMRTQDLNETSRIFMLKTDKSCCIIF